MLIGVREELTSVVELAVTRIVGEVEGAGPPVPETLPVRPRARLGEVAAGPPRQQAIHHRLGLFRHKALQNRRVRLQIQTQLPAERS